VPTKKRRRRVRRPRSEREGIAAALLKTAGRLALPEFALGDLKVAATSLREMERAFRMFGPYADRRKVSTFGSARTRVGDTIFTLAEEFSRRIADAGFMVITGAGPGIMEACQRGAGRERSFGVNIRLPFEQMANPVIHGDVKLATFHYFFTRKLFFLKEADAVVLFPGGFGTHDEGFETLTLLQTGKTRPIPLIFLDRPGGTYWKTMQRYIQDHLLRRGMVDAEDLNLYRVTDSVDVAVDEIVSYYRVYHSSRFVRDRLVIRMMRQLPDDYVAQLEEEFKDIIVRGRLRQREAFGAEEDQPDLAGLPRLVFRFKRMSLGRLRMLIDSINNAPLA
jgi:uncharacterized protein (TIGR00730 family)